MTYAPNLAKLVLLTACIWGVIVCAAFLVKRTREAKILKESRDAMEAEKHEREIARRADELYEQFLREVS